MTRITGAQTLVIQASHPFYRFLNGRTAQALVKPAALI